MKRRARANTHHLRAGGDDDERGKKARGNKKEDSEALEEVVTARVAQALAERDKELEARLAQLEKVMTARFETAWSAREKQLEDRMRTELALAPTRRAGARDIVLWDVDGMLSEAAFEANVYLNGLSCDDRCEYMVTLCEELDVPIESTFLVRLDEEDYDIEVEVFSNLSSEKALRRVLYSPVGGWRAIKHDFACS